MAIRKGLDRLREVLQRAALNQQRHSVSLESVGECAELFGFKEVGSPENASVVPQVCLD